MSASDKETEINLHEMTHEVDLNTGKIRQEINCGPCRDGNHTACSLPDCPCARNKHQGL